MIDSYQVKQFVLGTHALLPPMETMLLHDGPLVQRVAPALSGFRKIIRWHTSHVGGPALVIQ